ncbi:MAG: Uma2 family endonuclease [Chloroflexaceae bacterium]|nr:Uma2 family endonuclease [Chloroflexaceae bacterium]
MPTITAPPAPPSDYTVLPAAAQAWTEADLLRLGHDDHRQYELVRGELRQMSPASPFHGRFEIRMIVALSIYLANHPLGEIFPGDTGFILQSSPLTIRAPDVAFVTTARIPTEDVQGLWRLAPDLVIEIVSPSESARTIAEKVSDYLAAGTRLLWVVYPEQQHVHEYRAAHAFHIYHAGDTLDGRDVLPGFQYALATLFG